MAVEGWYQGPPPDYQWTLFDANGVPQGIAANDPGPPDDGAPKFFYGMATSADGVAGVPGFAGTGVDLITAAGQATGSAAGNGLPGLGGFSLAGLNGWWLVAAGLVVLVAVSARRR